MAETWPAGLPQHPTMNGYSTKKGDGRVVTTMQQGPPRVRRLYSNMPRSFTGSYIMTVAQWAVFNTFYDTTLIDGTLSVNLPLRTPTGVEIVEVLFLTIGAQTMISGELITFNFTAVEA